MSEIRRFDVRFHPDAEKEYNELDNSFIGIVNKAIDDLEIRADEVGKPLRNSVNSKLAGCKEKNMKELNGINKSCKIIKFTIY